MRVAVSGTHRVGKTTLARAISDALPGHDFADEPYHDLVAEGHVFSHPPGVEDFEEHLEHSLTKLGNGAQHVVFDRCPVDLLAYLMVASRRGRRRGPEPFALQLTAPGQHSGRAAETRIR